MLIIGNALHALGQLKTGSVQTCVTSPPYWGLRDYGDPGQEWPAVEFELRLGGLNVPVAVPAMTAPLGLEATPIAYVAHIVAIFREVRRALADDGTAWLNVGDTHATQGGQSSAQRDDNLGTPGGSRGDKYGAASVLTRPGTDIPAKNLLGVPWLLAYGLRSDGWYLRSDIIWHKRNPVPESVTDRPTKGHEHVFMLAKRARYLARMDAVAEKTTSIRGVSGARNYRAGAGRVGGSQTNERKDTRNIRTIWSIATQRYTGSHFAVMPPELARRCIEIGSRPGDTVLDPFAGACTVGVVAEQLGREFVGIELSEEYAQLGRERMARNREKLGTLSADGADAVDGPAQLGLL